MDLFTKLTAKLTDPKLSVEEKLKEICVITSSVIHGADRVSLWRFDADFHYIESLMCYDTKEQSFIDGQKLYRTDFKEYFDGILLNDVINAAQARSHPLTKCFNESYFEPLDIYSLLDFILYTDFVPTGIICCEGVGKEVQWQDEDIKSLKRIANTSSMFFKI